MPPAKPGEAGEVTVGSDKLAARLDRESGCESVGRKVALRTGFHAQPFVDRPMAGTGGHQNCARLGEKGIRKLEGALDGRRGREDSRMCRHPDESTQDDLSKPKRFVGRRCDSEPVTVARVIRRTFVKGEDVDVGEDQASVPSIRSIKAALSSRSTPGRSLPLEVGSAIPCSRTERSRRLSDSRRASSTTSFRVLPDRTASTLASARSRSSSLIVVLMHQSIRSRIKMSSRPGPGGRLRRGLPRLRSARAPRRLPAPSARRSPAESVSRRSRASRSTCARPG